MDEISNEFETWPDQIICLFSNIPLVVEKASIRLCYQHNSFSLDGMFLKLADKVDMYEIFNEFETWPDQIICLLSYILLIVEKASVRLFYQHNSFNLDWMFLKLADMVEISNEFETCQIRSFVY